MAPIDLAVPAAAKPATPPPITKTFVKQKHPYALMYKGEANSPLLHILFAVQKEKREECGRTEITPVDLHNMYSYLSWGDFSCSCDLTRKEPAKVVASQNHSLVSTKQSHLL